MGTSPTPRERRKAMKREDVTPEIIRELLDYDPETGVLTWKERDKKWFKSARACSAWNAQYSGKSALVGLSGPYFKGRIFNIGFYAHRVAWAHYYGKWPDQEVDHKEPASGHAFDNRISNLRDVSCQENARNARLSTVNTSGTYGVHWHKRYQKWVARIKIDGKSKHLGNFALKTDAITARKAAERKYGFSENHGRRPQ